MQFPSLKSTAFLAVLTRKPLQYRIDRQKGSHRTLISDRYPKIGFSWHDGVTIPGRLVRKVLVDDVGLTESEALELL